MKIEELDSLRNQLHKQFINRQPSDVNTIKILVGIGDNGVTEEKSELLKALAFSVAELGLDDTLVYFSTAFNDGLEIHKPNQNVIRIEKACVKCAEKIVRENVL